MVQQFRSRASNAGYCKDVYQHLGSKLSTRSSTYPRLEFDQALTMSVQDELNQFQNLQKHELRFQLLNMEQMISLTREIEFLSIKIKAVSKRNFLLPFCPAVQKMRTNNVGS